MKREIKFRAQKKTSKEWIYWDILDGFSNPKQIIDESTIGQFTGLYDKNGKEIYEGDIVEVTVFCKEIKIIKWRDGVFWCEEPGSRFDCHPLHEKECFAGQSGSWPYYYKVIGNIYENENLLTKKI